MKDYEFKNVFKVQECSLPLDTNFNCKLSPKGDAIEMHYG